MKSTFSSPHLTESDLPREYIDSRLASSHLPEEQQLIQYAQAGNADAVAELYRRHAPAIFRYVFFRMNDRTAAEDLTGDVFLEMMQALNRYTERGAPFAAWLFRIAHARVVDYHRRHARRPTETLSETLPDHTPGPELQATHHAEMHVLLSAMQILTDEQRTVIQLRFVEGHSLEATAQIMRKTPGAIKALQHRALGRLGRHLQP